jgi:ribonuclease HI
MTKSRNSNRIVKIEKKVFKSDHNIKFTKNPLQVLGTLQEDPTHSTKDIQDLTADTNTHNLRHRRRIAEANTNNTAEVTAIAEALQWISQDKTLKNVLIRYDSEYAAKAIQGIYKNVLKNIELIRRTQDLLTEVSTLRSVHFDHVTAHSTDVWNNRVDLLAKLGSTHTSRARNFAQDLHEVIEQCMLGVIARNT